MGYEGLKPKSRTDLNTSRKLTIDAQNKIIEYKKNYPHINGTLIYQKLIEDGYIKEDNVSKSTVLKFIRDNYILFSDKTNVDRRAFEMQFSNVMWDADTSHGPFLTINNKKIRTYLIALIDDASRLITNAKFYFEDNAINFQDTFKDALKKYGIPKKIFLDNGKTYKNEQLSIICASCGIQLIYTKPYSPQSKAKIERWFHTMKSTWMRGIDWDDVNDIDELNDMLLDFVTDYNNKIHSALKNNDDENISPKTRWFMDQDKIKKIDNDLIDEYFLHTAYPKIRSDAIAYIKKKEYEVPTKYIGKKITVKYDFKILNNRLNFLKEHRGMALITGSSGSGKTFVIRNFINKLNSNLYKSIYICMSTITVIEFYKQLCYALDIEPPFKKIDMFREIQERIVYLVKEKKRNVIIVIDEAQYLKTNILNDLKILFNFELDSKNYVSLILVGEPLLNNILSRNIYEALAQRIKRIYRR